MKNKYPIYHDIKQQTPEWFKLKELKMSASHGQAIGNCGAGLNTYITEMLAEYYSTAEKIHYSNKDIDRGNELEPEARSIYEFKTGKKVREIGFVEYNKYVGCSPDGLVCANGGIEIKCPNDYIYFSLLLEKDLKVNPTYMWQIQMNMLITGKSWWDYIVYNPNFKKDMLITRVKPNLEQFKKLEEGFEKGREMIEDLINKYEENGKTK